jgi:urea transport system ATP-binding protein
LSFALDVADRVLVIENGEIVQDDACAAVDEAEIAG